MYFHVTQRKEKVKKQQLQLKNEQDGRKRLLNAAVEKMKRTQRWEPPEGIDLDIDIARLERQVQEEMHDSPDRQLKREQEAREREEIKKMAAKVDEERRQKREKEAKEEREKKRQEDRRKKDQEAQEREARKKAWAQEEEQEKNREEERLKRLKEKEEEQEEKREQERLQTIKIKEQEQEKKREEERLEKMKETEEEQGKKRAEESLKKMKAKEARKENKRMDNAVEKERLQQVKHTKVDKVDKRANKAIPNATTVVVGGPESEKEQQKEAAASTDTATKAVDGTAVSSLKGGEVDDNRDDVDMLPEAAADAYCARPSSHLGRTEAGTESAGHLHLPSPPSYPPRLPTRPRPPSKRAWSTQHACDGERPTSAARTAEKAEDAHPSDARPSLEQQVPNMHEQKSEEEVQEADDFRLQVSAHTQSGDLAAIIAGMRRHRMDACIQKLACQALWILAQDNNAKENMHNARAVEHIVEAMNVHKMGTCADTKMQIETHEQALGVLWSLARHADNRKEIVAHGGIRAIIDVMLALPSEAVIQERACGILWNLLESPDCLIPEKDVIMALAEALRNNTTHAGVVTQSCGALMSVARNYNQRQKDVQHDNIALISSSIGIILDVMRAHQSHPVIQAQGCGALMNIFNIMTSGSKAKGNITCLDATPVILEALRAHPMSRSVQMRGCGVLWSLATSEDMRGKIVQDSGIEIICEALRCHASDADVQERACGVLWSLVANSHDHSVEARMADIDAAGLLHQAMKRHAVHVGLMKNAHGALTCLAKKMTKSPYISAGV